MAFRDMVGELIGLIPDIPPDYAENLINKSWRQVQDMRLWSFNLVNAAEIWIPNMITAGTLTATYGGITMLADATAKAALDAVALANPPLVSTQIGEGRQLRIGTSNTGINVPAGPIYSIMEYDSGTGILTLDRPYGEVSTASSPYMVYRCYITPPNNPNTSYVAPDAEFIKYWSIRNMYRGYAIQGKSLYRTQQWLNSIDPQRGSLNDAYYLAQWGRNRQQRVVHELYPHPTYQTTYVAAYQIRWPNLSSAQDMPLMPYDIVSCVIARAKMLAAQWALANVGVSSKLQGTNWVAAGLAFEGEFKETRMQCIKQDDEIAPLLPVWPNNVSIPLGGEFLQSHDLSGFVRNG